MKWGSFSKGTDEPPGSWSPAHIYMSMGSSIGAREAYQGTPSKMIFSFSLNSSHGLIALQYWYYQPWYYLNWLCQDFDWLNLVQTDRTTMISRVWTPHYIQRSAFLSASLCPWLSRSLCLLFGDVLWGLVGLGVWGWCTLVKMSHLQLCVTV